MRLCPFLSTLFLPFVSPPLSLSLSLFPSLTHSLCHTHTLSFYAIPEVQLVRSRSNSSHRDPHCHQAGLSTFKVRYLYLRLTRTHSQGLNLPYLNANKAKTSMITLRAARRRQIVFSSAGPPNSPAEFLWQHCAFWPRRSPMRPVIINARALDSK